MKQKIVLLIALLAFVMCIGVNADTMNVEIENKTARCGEIVTINVDIKQNPGVLALLFELNYDTDRLELVSATDKRLVMGAVFSKTVEENPYIMLWNSASATNFSDTGTLVELKFKVLDNAPGGTADISLSYKQSNVYDVDLNDVSLTIKDGSITVLSGNTENNSGGSTSGGSASGGSGSNKSVKKESVDSEKTEEGNAAAEENNSAVSVKYTDVSTDKWYFDAVRYVTEKKLMNGVAESEFAPNERLTRAMLVTILYRAAGEPAVNKSIPFEDVDMSAYYANAVIWAKQNSIVNGATENSFAPNTDINREQMAAILYRYMDYKGKDLSVGENTNILSYTDAFSISEYAIPAIQWAVGSAVMGGKGEGMLDPKGFATRAEAAAVLVRAMKIN